MVPTRTNVHYTSSSSPFIPHFQIHQNNSSIFRHDTATGNSCALASTKF